MRSFCRACGGSTRLLPHQFHRGIVVERCRECGFEVWFRAAPDQQADTPRNWQARIEFSKHLHKQSRFSTR